MNSKTEFIATTTAFLKKLLLVHMSGCSQISITVKGDCITLNSNVKATNYTFLVNTIIGQGDYVYSHFTIAKLIKCLQSLQEQPVTFVLDDYIRIKEIIF